MRILELCIAHTQQASHFSRDSARLLEVLLSAVCSSSSTRILPGLPTSAGASVLEQACMRILLAHTAMQEWRMNRK